MTTFVLLSPDELAARDRQYGAPPRAHHIYTQADKEFLIRTHGTLTAVQQALALLEARGVSVEHLGRLDTSGCLMWRVEGHELDKDGVIAYARRLAEEAT